MRLKLCWALLLVTLVGVVGGLLKCPGPCTPPLHCRTLGGSILGYCINHKACCDCKKGTFREVSVYV